MLLLLLSLYCIDPFSCKAASVFIIDLLTYLLMRSFAMFSTTSVIASDCYTFYAFLVCKQNNVNVLYMNDGILIK